MSKTAPRSRAAHPSGATYTDIEAAARDANGADSCSSLEEDGHPYSGGNGRGNGASLHGGNGMRYQGGNGGGLAEWGRRHSAGIDGGGGSGGSDDGRGVLDWQADKSDESQQQQQRRPWWRSGAHGIALVCLLLTLGSFVVPESEDGVGLIMKHVRTASTNARVR